MKSLLAVIALTVAFVPAPSFAKGARSARKNPKAANGLLQPPADNRPPSSTPDVSTPIPLAIDHAIPPLPRPSFSKECGSNPSVLKADIELSPVGQKKVLETELGRLVAAPAALFNEVPRSFSFGANPAECSKEIIEAKPGEYAWQHCYGPPYILLAKNPADKRSSSWADKPEPSSFEFTDFQFKGAVFGPQTVSCAHRTCKVRIPVEHLETSFDFRLKSIYEKCYSAGLRDVNFTLQGDARGVPYLEAQVHFGDQDQTVKLVSGQSKIVFPVGSLSTKSTMVRSDSKAAADKRLNICSWADPELLATISQQLLKEKLKDQFVLDQISEKIAESIFEPLGNRLAKSLENLPPFGADFKLATSIPEVGRPATPRSETELALLAAVEKSASTLDALPFLLNICVSCYKTGVPGMEPIFSGFSSRQVAKADLAVHAGYLSLNRALEFAQRTGRLDFCLSGKKMAVCDEKSAHSSNFDKIRFLTPPTIGWSDEKQSFYVDAPNLQYDTNHGSVKHLGSHLAINTRVYGKFDSDAGRAPARDLTKIKFTATSADVRGAVFAQGDLWGLASSIADQVVKSSFGRNIVVGAVKSAATQELESPEIGLRELSITADRSGLEVFSNIQDVSKLLHGQGRSEHQRAPGEPVVLH